MHAQRNKTIFDFRLPEKYYLLPLFTSLDPAWQDILRPLVQLPGGYTLSLSACTGIAGLLIAAYMSNYLWQ